MIPLISVVIISNRSQAILRRALESVWVQTYPEVEVVLVRDGDPSPSRDTISGLDQARRINIQIVSGNPNPLSDNYMPAWCAWLRNYGVSLASGSYVSFLDDDNEFEPNHLTSLLNTIQSTHSIAAFSHRRILTSDGLPYLQKVYPWPSTERSPVEQWEYFHRRGVVNERSNIYKDILGFGDEVVVTVDTSEWLLQKWVCDMIPFRETYTDEEITMLRGEDYLFAEEVLRRGLEVRSSELPTLRYFLGGYSNQELGL